MSFHFGTDGRGRASGRTWPNTLNTGSAARSLYTAASVGGSEASPIARWTDGSVAAKIANSFAFALFFENALIPLFRPPRADIERSEERRVGKVWSAVV